MTEPVNLSLFTTIWAIIVYALSLFYGLLAVYVGFTFMISGHDVIKREHAKAWFKNIIVMMVLIQGSYFLYGLILQAASLLTEGIVGLIDPTFFLINASTFSSFAVELLFSGLYLLTLIGMLFFLVMRYLAVGVGVAFFPLAIFLSFIPPLKGFGRLLLNLLGILIGMTFFQAVILLAASQLVSISLFSTLHIIVSIAAFSAAMLGSLFLLLFAKHNVGDLGIDGGFRTIGSLVTKLR